MRQPKRSSAAASHSHRPDGRRSPINPGRRRRVQTSSQNAARMHASRRRPAQPAVCFSVANRWGQGSRRNCPSPGNWPAVGAARPLNHVVLVKLGRARGLPVSEVGALLVASLASLEAGWLALYAVEGQEPAAQPRRFIQTSVGAAFEFTNMTVKAAFWP